MKTTTKSIAPCFLLLSLALHADAQRAELVVQSGHTSAINCLAFTPDSRYLASGGHDSTIRLWDVATRQEYRVLRSHTGVVTSLAFSSDGKTMVSASLDTTVKVWDMSSHKVRLTLKGTASADSITISPDGHKIAAGYWDHTIICWDMESGRKIRTMRGHSDRVNSVAFSPNGETLASASDDYTIRTWDVLTGKERSRILVGDPAVRIAPQLSFSGVNSICWSPRGEYLASVSWKTKQPDLNPVDFTISLWDAHGTKQLHALADFRGGGPGSNFFGSDQDRNALVGSPVFFHDRNVVAAVAADYTIAFWNADTGATLAKIPILFATAEEARYRTAMERLSWHFNPHLPTLSSDGKYLAVIVENNIQLRSLSTGVFLSGLGHHSAIQSAVAFHPKDSLLATSGGSTSTLIWDLNAGKATHVLKRQLYPSGAFTLGFSGDGNALAMAGGDITGNRSSVEVWDTQSWNRTRTFVGGSSGTYSLAFLPDQKTLITGRLEDAVSLWDTLSGQEVLVLEKNPSTNIRVAINRDGLLVARACSMDAILLVPALGPHDTAKDEYARIKPLLKSADTIRVWNLATKAPLFDLKGHSKEYFAIAFDPKYPHLAGGGSNGAISVWSTETGKEIRVLQGDTVPVFGIAFSPDGAILATGLANGVIDLWNFKTGTRIHRIEAHQDRVNSVAFNHSGSQLASASSDGTIALWNVMTGQRTATLIPVDNQDYMICTPDNYYSCTREALNGVAFRIGDHAHSFEQFDLKYNRPDRVMQALGSSDTVLIAAYKRAYLRRLLRNGFTEEQLGDTFHLPEIAIETRNLTLSTDAESLAFQIRAHDATAHLDRILVYVNGVRTSFTLDGQKSSGPRGFDLRQDNTHSRSGEIKVELSQGRNRIEAAVLNSEGLESIREAFEIDYVPKTKMLPDLYVVAIGISDYSDPRYKLRFAHKDAQDILTFFGQHRENFGQVHLLSLIDKEATRENIMQKAGTLLQQANVNDQVVFFLAGHGLLDHKQEYYFGTPDIDFSRPADRGFSYESMTSLMEQTRARKKLLLIDTCHSGEVDRAAESGEHTSTSMKGEVQRGVRAQDFPRATLVSPTAIGLKDSYDLLEEEFADLRRNSGTVIISAASGTGYSLESDMWQNGVFTACVLQALQTNKHISVSRLRQIVLERVQDLTAGRQHPTVREDNVEFDFDVY